MGVSSEFRPNPGGRADSGKGWLSFESIPGEGVGGAATLHRDDGSDLEMAEDARHPIGVRRLAILFVADGKLPQRVEYEPVALVLQAECPLGPEIPGILRLLGEVRCVVERLR